tara:strand:- start:2979 stop:4811 length:1833 start_codon:yes stop_codon:yes gene_type:complete
MQLKSSKKSSLPFLLTLLVLAALLFSLGDNRKADKFLETPEFDQKTNLDLIQLTFSEKAFKKIKKKRLKALSAGILETSDSDYVPVTVSFNGEDFRAEARLKGDWTDHLKGEKWSFRIKLKNDKTILGMRKFSIHHPQTRGHYYMAEWLYLKAVKREDLIGLRYNFIESALHIKSKNSSNYESRDVGIYAMEETFDKRTLESNGMKESVILKFSEQHWWDEVKKSIEVGSSYGSLWSDFMNYKLIDRAQFPILPFSEEKTVLDGTMNGHFRTGKELLESVYTGEATLDEAFDVQKLAKQNAILNLFGAIHGTYIINLRFYYNPITSLLEPIAFDGDSGEKLTKYTHFMFLNKEKDSVYLKELAYALHEVSQPEYLNDLMAKHKPEMDELLKPLKNEIKNSRGFLLANLEYNQDILRGELQRLIDLYIIKDIKTERNYIEEVKIPDVKTWINNNNILTQSNSKRKNKDVYNLSRDNISANAYTVITNNKLNYGRTYSTSIIAKKGKTNNLLGFRTQGEYPNRVDAIFDLDKGVVKDQSIGGNFKDVNATIKSLGNDWYLCTLSGKIMSSNVKIILGPTINETDTGAWEGLTNKDCDIFIIPSSLSIEENSK